MQGSPVFLEVEFQRRRRRVVRASGALFASAAAGLGLLALLRLAAPEHFEAVIPLFVLTLAGFGLRLWRTLRRDWRCPCCSGRWQHSDVLASAYWNHCAHCGVQLRAAADVRPHERIAAGELELSGVSREDLIARFARARRISAAAAGGVAALGIVAFAWVQARGFGQWLEQLVIAVLAGTVTAVVFIGARCPRCRSGVVVGKRRHCQRCGLSLLASGAAGLSEAAAPRTEG